MEDGCESPSWKLSGCRFPDSTLMLKKFRKHLVSTASLKLGTKRLLDIWRNWVRSSKVRGQFVRILLNTDLLQLFISET